MIGGIFGRSIVDVKYTGSFRETIVSMHYSETSSDIDMMYIYKDFLVSETKTCHLQIVNSKTPGYLLYHWVCF